MRLLFRGVCFAVVALAMPHEPDLGLGRPGATNSLSADLVSAARFQILGRLRTVKADLAAARTARNS